MPPTVTEQLNGRTYDRAASTARRTFRVHDAGVGVTEPAALAAIQLAGLGPGHAHPSIAGLVARGASYQQNGSVVDVTIPYVVPELAGNDQPPVDPLNPNFESMSTTFRVDEVALPSFEVRLIEWGEGDAIESAIGWYGVEIPPISKTVHVFTYRLSGTFTASIGPTQWLATANAIRAQANRLHKFGSTYYLFEPRTINQERSATGTDPARFRIEYNWTFDPGIEHNNDWTLSAGDQPLLRGDGARFYPIFDDQYVVPPWKTVWTAPASANDPTQAPVVIFRDAFVKDDNGWQTLPGLA